MFRTALPVVLFILATPGAAQQTTLPPIGEAPRAPVVPNCTLQPGSQDSCARVLACIGDEGLYFDGGVYGWEAGIVLGARNDGVACAGHWQSGGFLGTGTAQLECKDGLTVQALYYSQDSMTGTAIGRGTDSIGRAVVAWSGENVLGYLTPDGRPGAELPCGPTPIPIS